MIFTAWCTAAPTALRRQAPLSSMSPTFVEDQRGTLILGAPGGSRIISMVLLAILNYQAQAPVDLQALVSAPRYHHQYLPDRLEVEPDAFPSAVLDELQLTGMCCA